VHRLRRLRVRWEERFGRQLGDCDVDRGAEGRLRADEGELNFVVTKAKRNGNVGEGRVETLLEVPPG